ncbi:MAG: redoxin domain-containing protein [Brevundimonas sp.]|uniref:redoxin domain-containing protein n=1 Tax=Brevundimonas sp. TaxID=1871086 RepID=UPI002ABB972F|nr:redoxin domain-containing protein [Brevundimonas sp.]MDZ4110922.1 redoxin domain-containing protein [Brevundimonas sp.]
MIIRLLATGATLALLAACSPATEAPETGSAETAEAPAADMAPAFTLVDAEGVERSLADFRGRTVVLEWTNEGCPYVQKHYEAGAMQALQREATGDGVVWLTIISSAPGQQGFVEGDAAREWQSRNNAAATHLLLDPEGTVGRLYDARTTPDMRVIDPEGRLLFVGGIDDRPTNKIEDLEGANNYVKAALADMEAGRPVATPFATPYGCSIKYADELEGA